jgi:hypothetical protein
MIVISHQTICEDFDSPQSVGLGHRVEEGLMVSVAPKRRLSCCAPIHDVIHRIGKLDPQWTRHGLTGTRKGYNYSTLDLTPYPFIHKDISFAHERELRAVIWDRPQIEDAKTMMKDYVQEKPGVSRPVDIDDLVQNIYLSPSSETWFADVVKTVVSARYGLNIPVLASRMVRPPQF